MTGATLVTSSGYLTRPSRTRGRHRKQPPPGRLLLRWRLALGGSAVLLATLIVTVGALVKWATHETVSPPTAMPSTTTIAAPRSEEHTSELQSRLHLVCRLLLEKKNNALAESTPAVIIDRLMTPTTVTEAQRVLLVASVIVKLPHRWLD